MMIVIDSLAQAENEYLQKVVFAARLQESFEASVYHDLRSLHKLRTEKLTG